MLGIPLNMACDGLWRCVLFSFTVFRLIWWLIWVYFDLQGDNTLAPDGHRLPGHRRVVRVAASPTAGRQCDRRSIGRGDGC